MEIVIEAVFGCGPECDGVREKLLYGFGKDMSSVMAQQFQRVFMVAGHDLHSGVFDRAREIAQFAIDLDRKRGIGEARTDIRGERRARHRAVKISDTAVRECNCYHQTIPCRLRDGEERTCLAQGQSRFNLFDADIRQLILADDPGVRPPLGAKRRIGGAGIQHDRLTSCRGDKVHGACVITDGGGGLRESPRYPSMSSCPINQWPPDKHRKSHHYIVVGPRTTGVMPCWTRRSASDG